MNVLSIALPSESDRSVQILDQITGVAKYTISGNNTEILHLTFNEMLKHFNQALLGFSLIIFAILLVVGTLNTAADGQFLGRNWNSVWTPVRIVIGILFVVPVKGGLCIGQYIFLYAILVGVNIATNVWDAVVEDVFNHYTPPAIPVYVANYAQQVVENQMILSTMQTVISQIFPGGSSLWPQILMMFLILQVHIII